MVIIPFGALIEIAHSAYVSDSMSRAARAAARAIAVVPDAEAGSDALGSVACNAIRQELDLDGGIDCGANWTLTVDTDLAPEDLVGGGPVGGDMVLVRIVWTREPWELGTLVASLDEEDDEPTQEIAVGLARRDTGTGG